MLSFVLFLICTLLSLHCYPLYSNIVTSTMLVDPVEAAFLIPSFPLLHKALDPTFDMIIHTSLDQPAKRYSSAASSHNTFCHAMLQRSEQYQLHDPSNYAPSMTQYHISSNIHSSSPSFDSNFTTVMPC